MSCEKNVTTRGKAFLHEYNVVATRGVLRVACCVGGKWYTTMGVALKQCARRCMTKM